MDYKTGISHLKSINHPSQHLFYVHSTSNLRIQSIVLFCEKEMEFDGIYFLFIAKS